MFFGALTTYLVGRIFYDTAGRYQQSRWAFAIIGVAAYFIGTYVGAVLAVLIGDVLSPGYTALYTDKTIALMGTPVGLIVCRITYIRLKKSWSKPKRVTKHTLDSDLITPGLNQHNKQKR